MKLESDTMAAWFGFVLRCDCGYAVKSEWNRCPKCGKPLEKPKFGKCQGSVVYIRPSEVARIVTESIFEKSKKRSEVRERVNVGGEISVTPMSDKDIYACKKYRGRGCCVEYRIKEPLLPSERNDYDEIVVRGEDR